MAELRKALARNDVAAVTALLDAGAPLPPDGLETVLRYGFLETALLLWTRGATVRTPGSGLTAASFSGNLSLVQWVYDTGVDTTVTSSIDFLAASGTPESAKVDIANYLLARGADGQKWAEASMTIPGCIGVAKLLVSTGQFDAKAKTSLIFRNNRNEYVSIEDFLALRKLDHPYTLAVLPSGSNALYVAIRNDNLDEVQRLLAAVPPPDLETTLHASTGTPLVYATARGNAAIIAAIQAATPAVAAPDLNELILAAVQSGSVEALAPLLGRRPRDAPISPAALTAAINAGATPVVHMLLGAGADANALNSNRVPPLGVVVLNARANPRTARPEHVMMAHALLAAGADPDVHVSVLYGSCKAFAKGKAEAFAVAMGW